MSSEKQYGKTTKQIAIYAMLLAILFAAKRILDMVPNVELITLLFIIYARHIGKWAYLLAVAFTGLECFVWGIHNWVIMYLYAWPLLITIVLLTKKRGSRMFYAILAAAFGLFFGMLCSIPYIVTSGLKAAIAWWIAGIPFDLIHCVSNFIICLVLFTPLDKLFAKYIPKIKKPEPMQ